MVLQKLVQNLEQLFAGADGTQDMPGAQIIDSCRTIIQSSQERARGAGNSAARKPDRQTDWLVAWLVCAGQIPVTQGVLLRRRQRWSDILPNGRRPRSATDIGHQMQA